MKKIKIFIVLVLSIFSVTIAFAKLPSSETQKEIEIAEKDIGKNWPSKDVHAWVKYRKISYQYFESLSVLLNAFEGRKTGDNAADENFSKSGLQEELEELNAFVADTKEEGTAAELALQITQFFRKIESHLKKDQRPLVKKSQSLLGQMRSARTQFYVLHFKSKFPKKKIQENIDKETNLEVLKDLKSTFSITN